MSRGPCFEVRLNRKAKWYVREVAGGNTVDHSQAYSTKWSATRSAKRRAARTKNATWRVMD